MRKSKKGVNPYIENIFGKWFKNVVLLILLIPSAFLIIYGVMNKWIDQAFGLELIFLFLGIFIGKWFQNGTK